MKTGKRKENFFMEKRSTLIVALLAIGMVLTGCPNGDDEGSENAPRPDLDTWTEVDISPVYSTGAQTRMNDIAYGNGVYIAVGGFGKITKATSPDGPFERVDADHLDGIFHTAQPPYGNVSLNCIAFANGVFVVGAAHGRMVRSTDNGVTWEEVTSGFGMSQDINSIIYANDMFVAVGKNNKIAFSTDNGATWNLATNAPGNNAEIKDIAYGGGKFVLVRSLGTDAQYALHPDGPWTRGYSNFSGFSDSINAVAYGDNTFVLGGSSGKREYSTDGGVSWPGVGGAPFGGFGQQSTISDIAYGGGVFVAVGNAGKMEYSRDKGEHWTAVTFPEGLFAENYSNLNKVVYIGPAGSERFFAVEGLELAYSSFK